MKKTGTRFLAAILAFCLALALPLGASAEFATFEDVLPPDRTEAPWYSEAVYGLYEVGVLSGASHFLPNRAVTREEFVTMLGRVARQAGKDLDHGQEGHYVYIELTDSDISDYAYPYLSWAVVNGIMRGDETGLAAKRTMTRQEMAVILMRFVEYMDLGQLLAEPDRNMEKQVCDQGQIQGWARTEMKAAYETGLVNGSYRFGGFYDPETNIHACGTVCYLDPGRTVTRAQAAQVVYNYLQRSGLELPGIG